MLRLVAAGVVGAAAIAACLAFGLDGLEAALSDQTAQVEDQGGTSFKAKNAAFQAQEKSGGESASTSSTAAHIVEKLHQYPVAISSETDARYLRSGPFAISYALVLLEARHRDGDNTNSAEVMEPHPQEVASSEQPALPLPKARPLSDKSLPATLASTIPSGAATAQSPSLFWFFEKIFSGNALHSEKKVASLPPEARGRTAVYDIETRTVYLPTGEILEAHSGLGEHMDDVRYVQEKGRGPTPPNVYALTLRERPFHGVQAIRLTPVNSSSMFGRDGILAHPYMMGENGQSNGCVSIQNYEKFFEAYQNGQVDRLIVVPRLSATAEIVNASATVEKRGTSRPSEHYASLTK